MECTGEVFTSIAQIDKGLLESAASIKQSLQSVAGLLEMSKTLKDNVLGNSDIKGTENYRKEYKYK